MTADSPRVVALTGASGLIGTALAESLRSDGVEVRRLVRRAPRTRDEVQWDPARHALDPTVLRDVDAVVNLSGVSIGRRRWTEGYKRQVLDSRVDSTTTVAAALADLAGSDGRTRRLVSASAAGYYGDTGEQAVDETGAKGTGFMSDVVAQWEAATAPAADAGVPVAHIRSAVVLADRGDFAKVLLLFKAGLGGKLGSGRQWFSWIALADEIAAIRLLLDHPEITGAVNLSAPTPVRNADYTATLGRIVHRPTVLTAPAFALRLALDGFADEGLLASQRVLPGVLDRAGFAFQHPTVDTALRAVV